MVLAFSGCTQKGNGQDARQHIEALSETIGPRAKAVNGQIALQHIVALSETIGPRTYVLSREAKAAKYIQETFQKLGYTVELQPFSVSRGERTNFISSNVIACKPGSSSQVLVVGAHYDSVEASKGADDNAAGVAIMLEGAEKVRDVQTPYSICFIAFGSEELRMRGSSYYVEQAGDTGLKSIVGMINLDRPMAGDIAYVHGSAGSLRDWILDRAQKDGFNVETKGEDGLFMPDGSPCDCSDYAPFEKVGIPFAFFEATNYNLGEKNGYTQTDRKNGEQGKIWHTKYDNLTYIDQTFPGRIDEHLNLFVTLLYETLTQYQK